MESKRILQQYIQRNRNHQIEGRTAQKRIVFSSIMLGVDDITKTMLLKNRNRNSHQPNSEMAFLMTLS